MEANMPVVKTKNGFVRGEWLDGTAVFRGIPYGGRTDGERRFLPPLPAEPWEGELDCTENGPICFQSMGSVQTWDDQGPAFTGGDPARFKVSHEKKDENCLVLNIVTPVIDDAGRPVLFYIHGGGYSSGSGVLVLGGQRAASEEDVVLVSINHRIGPFGYLYLGDMDPKYRLSGIAGLLDIVLALKWVQENIASFGGDPDRVTILGESGGGSKVSALLSMDCTEGLFHRAVIESGSSRFMFHDRKSGSAVASRALHKLGIPENRLEGLAAFSTEEIHALTEEYAPFEKSFVPTPDGAVMPEWDGSGFPVAEWAKDIPVIIGASVEEGAVFDTEDRFPEDEDALKNRLLAGPEDAPLIAIEKPLCTRDTVGDTIRYLKETAEDGDTAAQLYYRAVSVPQFCTPALEQEIAYKKAGVKTVYAYLVKYASHHPVYSARKFAWHTATLPLQMRIVLHKEDEGMSEKLCRMLMGFVREETPKADGLAWIPFEENERSTLIIDSSFRNECDPQKGLREHLQITPYME